MKPILATVLLTLPLAAFAAEVPPAHVMGAPNAPITIELYSDFQCPGCKNLHENTLKELRHTYVNSGKVKIVYRDVHLVAHKYAKLAGSYADAAEKLGLYDTVADRLFDTQSQWGNSGKVDEAVAAVVPAAQMTKLRAMAADPAIGRQLDETTKTAFEQLHINGTPTMIIHHGPIDDRIGQVSFQILSKYLDMLLAK